MNKFYDPPNTIVITLKEILDGTTSILYVSHDEEDGMWQFLDGSVGLDTENARVISLKEILELDNSIELLWDLPLGWVAERKSKDAAWSRKKKEDTTTTTVRNHVQGYLCRCCGKYHDELPMSYGSPVPDYCLDIPLEEQVNRVEINEDLCIVDGEYFFIRGCIEIPLIDGEGPFIWDVWVSISEVNYDKTINYWEVEGREHEMEPMFGWLSTSIPCYPETINLKTMVHTRSVGVRPYIELEPTGHPLAVEQREGITLERIKKIAKVLCDDVEEQQ